MSQFDNIRKKEYIECICESMDHTLRTSYFDDKDDKNPDYLSLEMHLTNPRFFKRIWHAIKYVFGFRSRYGDFDEILLDPKDAGKLKVVIDEYLKIENNKLK